MCWECDAQESGKNPQELQRNAIKQVGLNPKLDMRRACADFYVLERLAADGVTPASRRLAVHETRLAAEFSAYLDMAVGGELRHVLGMEKVVPDPSLSSYLDAARDAHSSRPECWLTWTRLRKNTPGSVEWLPHAAACFVDPGWKGRAVGGPGWATAAKVVYDYLAGKIKPRVFVDRCWTLEHNFGNVFDKVYSTYGLKETLELQARDEYNGLAGRASPEIRRLWFTRQADVRRDFDPAWLGVQWTEEVE